MSVWLDYRRYQLGIPREEYLHMPYGRFLDLVAVYLLDSGLAKRKDTRPLDEIMIPE